RHAGRLRGPPLWPSVAGKPLHAGKMGGRLGAAENLARGPGAGRGLPVAEGGKRRAAGAGSALRPGAGIRDRWRPGVSAADEKLPAPLGTGLGTARAGSSGVVSPSG